MMDVLLSFLLSFCKINKEFESFIPFFKNIYLEYCSVDKCKKLVSFVNKIIETRNMKTMIKCFGRRLTQPNIPMQPNYNKERHVKIKMDELDTTINKQAKETEIEMKSNYIYAKINENFKKNYN